VEIYDDEKLGGQGVRALRDIPWHMLASKAQSAQRNLEASISVVAADLHCAGPECVLTKDAVRDADPTYHLQLDRQHVFDARCHWIGKINHLPDDRAISGSPAQANWCRSIRSQQARR
jgi:hypothetical protein